MALSLFELVVVAVAAFRLTRILVADSITESARVRFQAWGANHGWAGNKAAELLDCAWCAGWWVSLATYAVAAVALGRWDDVPLAVHAVSAAAVAGVQGFLAASDPT